MKVFFTGALGRAKQIQAKLDQYFDALRQIGCRQREALIGYLDQDEQSFADLLEAINALESRLDGIRRDVETEIYGRRLLPDTRDDVLGLLEVTAPADRLRDRIRQRSMQADDASEAGLEVLEHQLATAEPFTDNEKAIAISCKNMGEVDVESIVSQIRARR